MLQRLCPKCRRIITATQTYCEPCQKTVDAANEKRKVQWRRKSNQAYDQRRDPKYRTFYNSADWRALSHAKMIEAGYQCERCKERGIISLAEEVHHLQAIQNPEGWERRLDMSNLICVCTSCHNEIHRRFGDRGRKKV